MLDVHRLATFLRLKLKHENNGHPSPLKFSRKSLNPTLTEILKKRYKYLITSTLKLKANILAMAFILKELKRY